MIGSNEYGVLNVYSNTTIEDINAFVKNHQCTKLVLQENWSKTASSGIVLISGNNTTDDSKLIIDLNGHTMYVNRTVDIYIAYLEIWDSSATETGVLSWVNMYMQKSTDQFFVVKGGTVNIPGLTVSTAADGGNITMIFEGGDINTTDIIFWVYNQSNTKTNIVINGGSLVNQQVQAIEPNGHVILDFETKITVAPYVRATYDANGNIVSAVTPDYFAVSTSDSVSGIYNYAYGYQWNLTAEALSNLTLPTNKTYYLWGRNTDGWYEFLHLRYDNDQRNWVAA